MVRHSINNYALVVVTALIAVALGPPQATACDTPVYRYAMYRWTPTPYELYYFHEDFWQEEKYNAKDAEIHEATERMATDPAVSANVVLLPVNTFVDRKLRSVPPDVRRHWEALQDQSLPQYMLVSPQGSRVFSGDLTVEQLESLVNSPARRRIADLLADGRSGVFLLLGGNDSAANDAAEKVLKNLAADVAAGKVELYMGPKPAYGGPAAARPRPRNAVAAQGPAKADDRQAAESPPPHRIGVVRLERNDAKERWLVETLLAVEPDLKDEEFEDQPMIFVVYGRGRALPPYIGKGITRTNMLDVLNFITSACSCTVKEQNPGVDLLTRYDWETAAEKLADRFGTEEGNEGFYAPDEFFPELIVSSGNKSDERPSEVVAQQPATVASANSAITDDSESTELNKGEARGDDFPDVKSRDDTERTGEASKPASPEPANASDTGHATDSPKVAALKTDQSNSKSDQGNSPAPPSTSHRDAAATNSWMYTLAIGIGVGLFLLIGASFILFKNR